MLPSITEGESKLKNRWFNTETLKHVAAQRRALSERLSSYEGERYVSLAERVLESAARLEEQAAGIEYASLVRLIDVYAEDYLLHTDSMNRYIDECEHLLEQMLTKYNDATLEIFYAQVLQDIRQKYLLRAVYIYGRTVEHLAA